jgi:hypothetical protein
MKGRGKFLDQLSDCQFPKKSSAVAKFSLIFRYVASYPMGVRRPRREADYSPPSSAEVKNAGSYTSTLPVRLHGVVLS